MTTYHEYLTLTKHLSKNTFNLSQAAQTVELLPDANALTNKFQELRHVKLDLQDNHIPQYKQVASAVLAAKLYVVT